MKSCKYEQMAYLYPSGSLTSAKKTEFETHMRTCGACMAIVSEVSGIRSMAAALGTEMPLAGLNERIMNGIRSREGKGAPSIQWAFILRWQRALAPAAIVACLLLLLGVFLTPLNTAPRSRSGLKAQTAAQIKPGKPSEYFVKYSLDAQEQSYLADDGDVALSSYFDNLMKTN